MTRPAVLTIAGSDPSGGAGIQADLKTFLALGVHGTSAVTALTVQSTVSVSQLHPVAAQVIKDQISAVCSDVQIAAAKTGMLCDERTVRAVSDSVSELSIPKLVVDPVLVASSGDRLMDENAIDVLVSELLPKALIITPNLKEAKVLSGTEVRTVEQMGEAAKRLHDMGAMNVVVTGGHLEGGEAIDVAFDGASLIEFPAKRIGGASIHGTGCTFSAAIVAHLATGEPVMEAIAKAKSYVTGAIRGSYRMGKGTGALDHMWAKGPGTISGEGA